MAKLTKEQSKLHLQACELLQKDTLNHDERYFVLENWHEGASNEQTRAGAFFTPLAYARTFAVHSFGRKILDLCAGIGMLAHAVRWHQPFAKDSDFEITCVELNPDYIEVGKKILPYARWICADVMDLPADIGRDYDLVISNPPFGRPARSRAPRYAGSQFPYKVIDVASDLGKHGVFIIPQTLAKYHISGKRTFSEAPTPEYLKFQESTGIELEANCGIDAAVFKNDWHGASVMTEVVLADFEQASERRLSTSPEFDCINAPLMIEDTAVSGLRQGSLFADAA